MATKAQKTATNGAETIDAALKTGSDTFKNGFEKAAKGYEQFVALGKDNAEAVLQSATVAGKGIESLNSEVFAFSRAAVEESLAATKALLASKTVQEMLEIQSGYAKSAFESYLAEVNKVREMTLDTAKASSEPLQARFTALVEMTHAA